MIFTVNTVVVGEKFFFYVVFKKVFSRTIFITEKRRTKDRRNEAVDYR